MQDLLQTLNRWLGEETWSIQVFLLIFAALLLDYFQRKLLRRLLAHADSTRNPWDDAVLKAARRPVSLAIWLVGITLGAQLVGYHTGEALFDLAAPLREVGLVMVLTWFLIRLVNEGEQSVLQQNSLREEPIDKTTVDAVGKLLRISIFITGVLVVLQNMGVSISGVLAFGGVGGLAVGLAAKDLLANFFGGLTVYLDRPFSVGDWIRSPDKQIEGTVEHIGWRQTRIRKFDKRPLYVPNATFTTITVENPSRMTHRRIYETIGIRYDDVGKMADIVRDVEHMLQNHPEIDQSQTLMVNFNQFAPSSLDFFIYTFTRTTNWQKYHQVKQDVLLKVADIIAGHGAEIAFPTTTVHLDPPQFAGMETRDAQS